MNCVNFAVGLTPCTIASCSVVDRSISDLARLEHAREVFEVVKATTGVLTLGDFMARFDDAEEKNYSIFRRVDALALESENLRAQICKVCAITWQLLICSVMMTD